MTEGSWHDPPKQVNRIKKCKRLGDCPPTGFKKVNKPKNKIHWVVSKVALGIYYIAFLFVSFGVGMEAHAEHHAWIVTDALNGLTGGFFLVYPFNIFRKDFADTLDDWLQYTFIMFFLTATASVIGGNLGYGSLT